MLINNSWASKEISREVKTFFELTEYENTTYQKLQGT